MLKSRCRIAGEVVVIATLAGSAAAQSPPAPINTINELEAALLALLGAAADRAVAARHADHGADELQTRRRAVRTAEDHISIERRIGHGARVVSHRGGGDA